ncbi:MAG: NYN domain-containing protein [Gammaproteobacteria bacterium WSBS_2016_MAG_OTU1]
MKNRANFYIDGLNIYHRIRDYDRKTNKNYRWLNYRSLCEEMLHPGDTLGDIYFFTSIAYFLGDEGIVARHQCLLDALESYGIKIMLGYFEKRRKTTKTIHGHFGKQKEPTKISKYDHMEIIAKYFGPGKEKQTDVNIATQMIVDAALKRCEKIFLFSGDNDFAPALRGVAEVAGDASVRTVLMMPPYENKAPRPKISKLQQAANGGVVKITFDSLVGHALPEEIETPHGETILMPEEYKTF